MACVEILKAELAAIDKQDRAYWQTEIPNRDEKIEYLVRQDRRRAIMDQLMNLMLGAEMLRSKSTEDVKRKNLTCSVQNSDRSPKLGSNSSCGILVFRL